MTLAQRVLPNPVLSFAIVALWMALAQGFDLGSFLLAVALALILPAATRSFWSAPPRISSIPKTTRLFMRVMTDIVLANVEVAALVLGPVKKLTPGFVEVPLDIEDPFLATMLGSIVTLTPGTVSVDIDVQRKMMLVHVLHLVDEEQLICDIKERYEKPLAEAFQC